MTVEVILSSIEMDHALLLKFTTEIYTDFFS